MKIAACFKTIPEFEMLTEQDWQVGDGYAVDVRIARQSFDQARLASFRSGRRAPWASSATALRFNDPRPQPSRSARAQQAISPIGRRDIGSSLPKRHPSSTETC